MLEKYINDFIRKHGIEIDRDSPEYTALSRELRHNTVLINTSKKAEHRTQYAPGLSLMVETRGLEPMTSRM